MRFTVVWEDAPTNDLADLWIKALDQQALADAADSIDSVLRTSPDKVGNALGVLRRLRLDPKEVAYLVSAADCLVTIKAVRRVP
jgi:hypothetical protein